MLTAREIYFHKIVHKSLNVSLGFPSGNIEILGRENKLFHSGPVIRAIYTRKNVQITGTLFNWHSIGHQ